MNHPFIEVLLNYLTLTGNEMRETPTIPITFEICTFLYFLKILYTIEHIVAFELPLNNNTSSNNKFSCLQVI
jgi:uncharacterized membrane protein YesL